MSINPIYNENRKNFYKQFNNFFPDFDELEYALYDTMKMTKEQLTEINYASNILWKIFNKVSKQFRKLEPEQLIALGIREEMIPYIGLDYLPQQSVLARFDFICTEDGAIKVLE